MHSLVTLGQPAWSRAELLGGLETFVALYQDRPMRNNAGGMCAPHMFLAWFALRALNPKAIVESGVWHGQGTWLFERACPAAQLYCIEPQPDRILYRSKRAEYFERDFSTIDWSGLPRLETVLFFDDHQNALERVKTAKAAGFRHLIFEDNYPPGRGDCYSLKQALAESGSAAPKPSLLGRLGLGARQGDRRPSQVPPNRADAQYLRHTLELYQELPPVFQPTRTRWGDRWDAERYPTPEPLLRSVESEHRRIFLEEAADYTWMCYARLK